MSDGNAVGLSEAGLSAVALRISGLPVAARDPSGRPLAPGALGIIQALVNTAAVEFDRDLLGSTFAAAVWLADAGLLPPQARLTEPELRALVELREAIRGELAAHNSGEPDPVAASRLTMALASCRLTVTVDPAGEVHLTAADHDPFARVVG